MSDEFRAGAHGAGEGRLAGDARPRAYPHAALSARPAGDGGAPPRRLPNPEDLAFARPADARAVSRARSTSRAVWQEGRAGDELLVEIFEHWLEPRMNILETDGEQLLAAVRDLLAAQGHRLDRRRSPSGSRSPMPPTPARARAWSRRPGPIRRIAR